MIFVLIIGSLRWSPSLGIIPTAERRVQQCTSTFLNFDISDFVHLLLYTCQSRMIEQHRPLYQQGRPSTVAPSSSLKAHIKPCCFVHCYCTRSSSKNAGRTRCSWRSVWMENHANVVISSNILASLTSEEAHEALCPERLVSCVLDSLCLPSLYLYSMLTKVQQNMYCLPTLWVPVGSLCFI